MIRHILIAGLRNLAASRLQSAIAIGGLAIGITAALLMGLVIRDQLRFNHFIPGHGRTYIGISELSFPNRAAIYDSRTNQEAAALLGLNAPEIESVTRLMAPPTTPLGGGGVKLRRGAVEATENIYWAEPNLAAVLPLPVFRGDLAAALARPDGIVLPRAIARKYFGHDDVVGEGLLLDGRPMTVGAVIEDLPQGLTDLESGIFASGLAPFSGIAGLRPDANKRGFGISLRTYLRLKPEADIAAVEAKVPALVERLTAGVASSMPGGRFPYAMQLTRIDRINRHEGLYPGARTRLIVEAAVGMLILLIAGVNFVNLVTARALRRAREVGMRKACGAGRSALVLQFLGESLMVVLFAACAALAMSEWLMPKVNAFLQTDAALDYWHSVPVAAAVLLGVGLFAAMVGAYPALLLAAFRPARTLTGRVLAPEGGGVMVRNVLTGLQFAILVVLIISAIVVFQQRDFATRDAVRADIDRMVIVRGSCLPAFRQELRKLPGVAGVSCTGPSFLDNQQTTSISHRGRPVSMNFVRVDPGIFALYGIKPLAGTLPGASEADANAPRFLVINQTAIRRLGFASPQAAIGQFVGDPAIGADGPPLRVAAVVPDFAFYSVERAMEATAFAGRPTRPGFDLVSVKLNGRDVPATLTAIDRLWSATGNPGPISRQFLDEHVRQLYSGMGRQGELLALFAGVAVLLACLGLFGLSVAAGERRIKEVGVRKAMGAAAPQVAALLLWQFSRPVLLANLAAWPVAFWLMRRWLSGFAYHVELHWWVFPAASGAALLLALLTVAGQTIYTARQKPVLALRYE